ncbi:replication initiation protein RepM [Acinetobacter guillouiae]|uniref:replication initiation protein RepM n=1 Tax=Acinetobacter guillouiae TaxID=106649 RepID=UPI003AF58113
MRELVVKDNALINASYNLDLVEQRLILLAIVEARESGKGINANDPLEVHAEGYINQFGVHRNTAYQALKDACNDLFARQFSYQKINERGNIENYRSRWVSEIGYVDNEAVVKLIFAPAIVPLITRLEEHFTKYELQQVSNLSSAYAVRLYELLIAWRSTGSTPVIELSDFRQRIGVLDTEYKRMERFKTSVLELAIKQINEHTDITVKYEQHKKGRSISGFSFTFKQKKKDNPSIERDPNALDLFSKMTDAQRHMFANKLSELPEMGRYSQGTESYPQFAVRIAEMLQDSEKIKELAPYLKKVGYMPSNKKDIVNG